MRFAGAWLYVVSALALSACHRPEKAAGHQPAGGAAATQLAASAKPASAVATAASAGSRPSTPPTPGAAPGGHAGTAAAPAPPIKAASRTATAPRRSTASTGAAAATASPDPASAGTALAPARAPRDFSAEYAACATSASGFTVALANCHSAELARQGARVDRAFNALVAARSGEAKRRLQQDQRGWLERRDAECRATPGRRSSDVLSEGSCRIDLTTKRAATLERMLG